MPHQEFVGLRKEERRAFFRSNNMKIIHKECLELKVRFWQLKFIFSINNNGKIHGLFYTIKSNSGTITKRTDANI